MGACGMIGWVWELDPGHRVAESVMEWLLTEPQHQWVWVQTKKTTHEIASLPVVRKLFDRLEVPVSRLVAQPGEPEPSLRERRRRIQSLPEDLRDYLCLVVDDYGKSDRVTDTDPRPAIRAALAQGKSAHWTCAGPTCERLVSATHDALADVIGDFRFFQFSVGIGQHDIVDLVDTHNHDRHDALVADLSFKLYGEKWDARWLHTVRPIIDRLPWPDCTRAPGARTLVYWG